MTVVALHRAAAAARSAARAARDRRAHLRAARAHRPHPGSPHPGAALPVRRRGCPAARRTGNLRMTIRPLNRLAARLRRHALRALAGRPRRPARRWCVGGAAVGGAHGGDRPPHLGRAARRRGHRAARRRPLRETLGDRVHVNVTSYNRQVLLTGEVPARPTSSRVEQVVARVDNVRSVVNELAVGPPPRFRSAPTTRCITGKVRASLRRCQGHLRQRLQGGDRARHGLPDGPRHPARSRPRHRDRARRRGVQKVVRVFEIVSEAELASQRQQHRSRTRHRAARAPASRSSVPLPPMEPLPPSAPRASAAAARPPAPVR